MKVLFLCPGGSACRSLIAKAVLHSFDKHLDIYAAGLTNELCPANELTEVMNESGFKFNSVQHPLINELEDIPFDFLITLCDGTREEFNKLPLKYNKKLHLGFADPEKENVHKADKKANYYELLEEMKIELSYFYYNILIQSKND